MNNPLIYVYCLSGSQPELTNNTAEGLQSLKFDDFFAVVKYVPEIDFSEENFQKHLSNISWLEIHVREHIAIINKIMEFCTVIPFKFGTIYNSQESLEKFIHDYSDSLTENFDQLSGKEEWAVKMYCDRNLLSKKIDELSVEAATLAKQIRESSPGKAFLLNKKKLDLIENEMDRICNQYGQEYFEEIKNLCEATSLGNILPKEFSGREDTMILNASFLIKAEKVEDFKAHINSLTEKVGVSGFAMEVSGPWPPFSFISIKEKT
ncbi:MAG: GvpL/GvpF family gas vesicle protein [Prolixibacteraceae bacterium]